jgi:phage tail sheath protein FI
MPEYLSPGVYVEELATGPRPIEGVSTSTVGFVGQTERGPSTPRLVTSWLDFLRSYGGFSSQDFNSQTHSYLPYCIKGFFDNGGLRAFVARVVSLDRAGNPPNPASPSTFALPTANANQNLTVEAIGPGDWGNRTFVRVDPGRPAGFRLTVLYYRITPPLPLVDPLSTDAQAIRNPNRRDPDAVEVYQASSVDPESSAYVVTTVNGASHLVGVGWSNPNQAGVRPADTPGNAPGDPPGYVQLAGGDNGAGVVLADYEGNIASPIPQRTGLAALDAVDDVSILCIPDEVRPNLSQLRADLQINCELNRYRFAIQQVNQGEGDVGTLVNQHLANYPVSSYVALYYPWIRVLDPITQEIVTIPPGGHVAGIYARTDEERGVHKAPANEDVRGILLRDVGDVGPVEFKITKGEHDLLNPVGVDVIRDFRPSNRGVRVWGARTRSDDPLWKYVNVRRLFIFVEKSIDEGTQWVVFEPNDEPTWAAVRRAITNFLIRVWRDGALMGATQDEAFFVKCDRTTMTEDDILNGRLICYVGLAPVRPAEFVIIRISQKTLEAEPA